VAASCHSYSVGSRTSKPKCALNHPLPWKALTYDTSQGGYVVDLNKDRLQGAPSYSSSEAPDWSDPGYSRGIDDFYNPLLGL
jgi:hypothetical protein